MNPLTHPVNTWYLFAAQLLVIMWGTIITFGPPLFVYLLWRGAIDLHRIAEALDRRHVWEPVDPKYIRPPRAKDGPAHDSIVPSAFGR